jgi:hypothetical protein
MKIKYLSLLLIVPLASSCCNKVVHDGKTSYPEVTSVDAERANLRHTSTPRVPDMTPTMAKQEEEVVDTSLASLSE